MTKKGYIKLADAIRRTHATLYGICNGPRETYAAQRTLAHLTGEVMAKLADDNPRFDSSRFMEAAQPKTIN